MTEKPREYKRRVDAEWRRNERNKNKLIKKIEEYELLDERYKEGIEREILKNFLEKEKEEKGEEYENILKVIEDVDKKYEALKQLKEELRVKKEEKEQKDREIAGTKLEGPNVTMLDQQWALRERLNKEKEEIEKEIEEKKKEIKDMEEEIKEIEEEYGKKSDVEEVEEEGSIEDKEVASEKTEVIEPKALKEYHDQTIKDLWNKDRIRGEIIKILEEGAGIGDELSKKIEEEVSEKFFTYYEEKQTGLNMKVARRLKNKLKDRKKRYEKIKSMPEGEEKEKKLRNLEELEIAYGVEPLAEIDRRKKEIEKTKEMEKIKEIFAPYRKLWKEKIKLGEYTKERIIEVADKIPVKVHIDADGSRLIEFKLEDKIYKILDPILDDHTSLSYDYSCAVTDRDVRICRSERSHVYKRGMIGNLEEWKNKPLRDYVKQKEKEGLHLAKKDEVKSLLKVLGKMAGLYIMSAQMAMLMYLTGVDGAYWLFGENVYPDDGIFFEKQPRFKKCGDTWRLNLLMINVTDCKNL